MSNCIEELKTKDLKCGRTGIIIKCTGNADTLMARHGIVIETEEDYTSIEGFYPIEDHNEGNMFKNGFIVSIGLFTRDLDFIERVRHEGFVSENCSAEVMRTDATIVSFTEKYKKELSESRIQRYNIGDGVTIEAGDGSLFDLADPAILTKNTEEVVKRIKISPELLREMTIDYGRGEELFRLIKEQMTSLNCPHYTFKRPDTDDTLLKFSKFEKDVELRACGLRQKD